MGTGWDESVVVWLGVDQKEEAGATTAHKQDAKVLLTGQPVRSYGPPASPLTKLTIHHHQLMAARFGNAAPRVGLPAHPLRYWWQSGLWCCFPRSQPREFCRRQTWQYEDRARASYYF